MEVVLKFMDAWKQRTFLQIFTIYLRYLIGGAFIIAAIGMGKLDGSSNLINSMSAPIQDLQPIQQFFRVMAESGLYWQFIGWTQIVAGILLMTQRFAKLGALIFFGMILNIFIITLSYDFRGTPIVTGFMLLATGYLLVWDLRSLQVLLFDDVQANRVPLKIMDQKFWGFLGVIMIVSIFVLALLKINTLIQLVVPFAEGLVAFIFFFTYYKRKLSLDQEFHHA
jgi:DoxX.